MKVCILSEYAYYHLDGKSSNTGGGAELQMALLAKGLLAKSHDVSFVTFIKSYNSYEIIEGIKVYNPFDNKHSGYTYLFPWNIFRLFLVLHKIDADVYIQRASTPLTGWIAFFTKLKKRIFLYSSSSDNDVSKTLTVKSLTDFKKWLYRYGVRHSDCVVCQTNHQKHLLKKSVGKEGAVIKNLYPLSKRKYNNTSASKIVWIGRLIKEKKPELYLKLAQHIPNYQFYMICATGGSTPAYFEYRDKIKEAASKIPNLKFMWNIPHHEIDKYYAESFLLVNTSPSEGFPNTFLEAWGNKIPVVSLNFDPDGIIHNNLLGFHSKTFEDMIKNIKTLIKNEELRKEMGKNSYDYVKKDHNIKKIVKDYELLIDSILNGG